MPKEVLMEFYGEECGHCQKMKPIVEKLEKDFKVKVKKLEVWHNAKNTQKLFAIAKDLCNFVPFFYNPKTKKHICGPTTYAKLKKLAEL